MEFFKLDLTVP